SRRGETRPYRVRNRRSRGAPPAPATLVAGRARAGAGALRRSGAQDPARPLGERRAPHAARREAARLLDAAEGLDARGRLLQGGRRSRAAATAAPAPEEQGTR